MTELALPAGSLQAALHAFEGGADAVYLGLRQYSARKHATNFSFEELAQLKQESVRLGKAIYVTLNTLLDDQELLGIIPTLRRLELLEPDGIIVQDLGLSSVILDEFPSLPVHASTQIAVHTTEGVRQLQRLGFSRIVLARELTYAQIEEIRKSCADVDLKVFIHGAMCYGFSGLCMASHYLTGRSANRGECAQICRTWFTTEGTDEIKSGYFFSMTDLASGSEVTRLRDIGINSLKIEGRMKSPAYVRFAARYYRMILDGETDIQALQVAKEELDSQFARSSFGGWTFSYGKEKPGGMRHTPSLTTLSYPGHRGTVVGVIQHSTTRSGSLELTVSLEREVSVRDGMMFLHRDENGLEQPVRFPLQAIRDINGRSRFHATAGSTILLDAPSGNEVGVGTVLYRVSRHDLHVSELHERGLPPFRFPLDIRIELLSDHMTITPSPIPSWIPSSLSQSYPIDVQKANREQRPRENLLRIFSSPGTGIFTARSVTLHNTSGWEERDLFLPLSRLKEIRRSWYEYLEKETERALAVFQLPPRENLGLDHTLPLRHFLNPHTDAHIPWADPVRIQRQLAAGVDIEDLLAMVDNLLYLPLPPVTFDEAATLGALERIVKTHGSRLRIGLNNVAHLGWARSHAEAACFADVYLYPSNRESAMVLLRSVPSLIGMYQWVERETSDMSGWPIQASAIGPDFTLPLFVSRNCFRYDSMGLPCEGCPRHGTWHVNQTGKRYRVDVRECVTIVSEKPEHQ